MSYVVTVETQWCDEQVMQKACEERCTQDSVRVDDRGQLTGRVTKSQGSWGVHFTVDLNADPFTLRYDDDHKDWLPDTLDQAYRTTQARQALTDAGLAWTESYNEAGDLVMEAVA